MLAFVGVIVLAVGPGLSANALPLLLVVGAAFAFAVSKRLDEALRRAPKADVTGGVHLDHITM
jgi:drug/metabolite transporter (DMT)-like permease